jgi:hypothetical protein
MITDTVPLNGLTTSMTYSGRTIKFGSLLYRAAKTLNLLPNDIIHCERIITIENNKFKIQWYKEDTSTTSSIYSKIYTKTINVGKENRPGRYRVEITVGGMLILKPLSGKAKKTKSRT